MGFLVSHLRIGVVPFPNPFSVVCENDGNTPIYGWWKEWKTLLKWDDLDVSENNCTPKSSILIWFSIINHPFFGYLYFWKHQFFPCWLPSLPRKTGTLRLLATREALTWKKCAWAWQRFSFFFSWRKKRGVCPKMYIYIYLHKYTYKYKYK